MLLEDIRHFFPKEWAPMSVESKYEAYEIPRSTLEYLKLESAMYGNFNLGIKSIYRIQNPVMYMKFQHKLHEYAQKGPFEILRLFHDSSRENAESISTYNFDWRFGDRFKFGPGVYFSKTAAQANAYSNKYNGEARAMFFADVLVANIQMVDHKLFFPDLGFDTVATKHSGTYVKYFDSEYYPVYVAFYYSST